MHINLHYLHTGKCLYPLPILLFYLSIWTYRHKCVHFFFWFWFFCFCFTTMLYLFSRREQDEKKEIELYVCPMCGLVNGYKYALTRTLTTVNMLLLLLLHSALKCDRPVCYYQLYAIQLLFFVVRFIVVGRIRLLILSAVTSCYLLQSMGEKFVCALMLLRLLLGFLSLLCHSHITQQTQIKWKQCGIFYMFFFLNVFIFPSLLVFGLSLYIFSFLLSHFVEMRLLNLFGDLN